MLRPRPPFLLALLAALVVALLAAPAQADSAVPRGASSTLTYRESGCTEIAYQRGGLASAVRPLVPERFVLADFPGVPEGAPARVQLLVNEVTCEHGRFPGRGRVQRPYSYVIVSASVTATEGEQRDGAYVLFYATENREQLAALRRLGWPLTSLSRRTEALVTRDTTGTPVGSALHVVGGGWDHDLAAVANAPLPEPGASAAEYYRDTPEGAQTSCFANQASVTSASYSGDLRGTPFASVAYVPPVFTGYPGSLVVGGWEVAVTTGGCPATAAPGSEALEPGPQAGSGTTSRSIPRAER